MLQIPFTLLLKPLKWLLLTRPYTLTHVLGPLLRHATSALNRFVAFGPSRILKRQNSSLLPSLALVLIMLSFSWHLEIKHTEVAAYASCSCTCRPSVCLISLITHEHLKCFTGFHHTVVHSSEWQSCFSRNYKQKPTI
jgi:hypothetical protein